MIETAYAKINLALHVRKRREDGYHELETVFAFADFGDRLSIAPVARDKLITVGEFGSHLTDPFDNIVARALAALPHGRGWAVTLEKNLPVAAGLGGGSADAGAIFRMVERAHGLPDDWLERAAKLGADVPACVKSEACIGRGTGTELEPIENDLSGWSVLLVNPRISLSTAEVFAAWNGIDPGPLPPGTARQIARGARNSLSLAATALCPPISEVLQALAETEGWMQRMSGSGATCFALYERHDVMDKALESLRSRHPDWWYMAGKLR